METVDYLRVARRRLWLLIGLPVLAAGVAALVVALTPQTYAVTAYVAAPALVGGVAAQQYTGPQSANQFVAAFAAAATSPKVVAQVSTDTGADPDDVRDGVKVEQVGASSQLTLTYTSPKRATVGPVARAMTARALTFLFSSQVQVATQQVSAAQTDVESTTKAITDWESANKMFQPDKLFQAALSEQGNLLQQKLSMTAVGNTTGASAASDALDASDKRLKQIGPKLPAYQALLAQRDAATGALAQARQGLQAANAQVGAADPAEVSSVGAVTAPSQLLTVAMTALPVAGAGLLIAVLLVALLEVLGRRRSAPEL